MKQVLQSLKSGVTEVADVPTPQVSAGCLLIKSSVTLISVGTERMLIEFGKAGLIDKARQQPEKVRIVLDKIRSDGLRPTIDAIQSKLDQSIPLGYCNVGRILAVGEGVSGYEVGQRVVSASNHAEVVSVPENLCAAIPDSIDDNLAVFTVLGAIGLQGIRLLQPTLGEKIAVFGLGVIGLLSVQILRANGCKVLAVDFNKDRLSIARDLGAETVNLSLGQDPVEEASIFSHAYGIDGALIATATSSNLPIRQAAQMCRKRGRIVLIGVAGLEISRNEFFEKELSFQVSCSYGPGRYDPQYESEGIDYPIGFVRWTEQRNFEAILALMADKKIEIDPIISHRFSIEEAEKAYALIARSNQSLGVILEYPSQKLEDDSQTVVLDSSASAQKRKSENEVVVGFLGAGNYATSTLMPAFKKAEATMALVASNGGADALHAARKFGFSKVTTEIDSAFTNENINALVVATRHNSHANLVLGAIDARKHVFVEKPLCLKRSELDAIRVAYQTDKILMVGFNRRFAPHIVKMRSLLRRRHGPKSLVMTINAGFIPVNHWTQAPLVGGGRIVGEGCHFVDLARHLIDCPIVEWDASKMRARTKDTISIALKFIDGSIATIHYFANGPRSIPKERIEVFASGSVLRLDNYQKLVGFDWPGFKKLNLWRQDKGQKACVNEFIKAIRMGGCSPIPIDEIIEVSGISVDLAEL